MILWSDFAKLLHDRTYHCGAAAFADVVEPWPPPGGLVAHYDKASGCVYVTVRPGKVDTDSDTAGAMAQAERLRCHRESGDVAVVCSPGQPDAFLVASLGRDGWCYRGPQEASAEESLLLEAANLGAAVVHGAAVFDLASEEGFVLREVGGGATFTVIQRGGAFCGAPIQLESLRGSTTDRLARILSAYRSATCDSLRAALRADVLASRDAHAIGVMLVNDATERESDR